ncbi:MAG TPA: phage holin family protein [Terriglobales bacterium]
MRWLIRLLLNAIALLIVSRFIAGFYVSNFLSAIIAAVVISIINATVGAFLKLVTFPLTILTLGIFWWVINALMLMLASLFVPGFRLSGFTAALLGAIVLALVNLVLRFVVSEVEGH